MTWGAVAVGAGTILSGYITGQQDREAQQDANTQNIGLTKEQIAEQKRQFDIQTEQAGISRKGIAESAQSKRDREDLLNQQMRDRFATTRDTNLEALDPYSQAGKSALEQQQALLGLGGKDAQEAAYKSFSESPGQRFLRERQEKSLLRNTAAIGGLGGGNVRTALQEQAFGRAATNFDNRYDKLRGLSGQGFAATQEGIRARQEPTRISTGVDVGVSESALNYAMPMPAPVQPQPSGVFVPPAQTAPSPVAVTVERPESPAAGAPEPAPVSMGPALAPAWEPQSEAGAYEPQEGVDYDPANGPMDTGVGIQESGVLGYGFMGGGEGGGEGPANDGGFEGPGDAEGVGEYGFEGDFSGWW